MRDKSAAEPFGVLGQELRALRTKAKESLSDTSCAVEIEVKQLLDFELGKSCPNEEILLLLISHFGPRDNEALRLWKLAGYSDKTVSPVELDTDEGLTLFTDSVEVTANQYGVSVEFKQNSGVSGQPKGVAKLGMSREHAESVIKTIAMALAKSSQIQNKRLLTPGNNADSSAQN